MSLEKWRHIAQRLQRMDGAELGDRLRQGLAKRQDGLLSRLHFDFAKNVMRPVELSGGRFFFRQDEVGSILKLLRQRVPGQVDKILQQADKIVEHRFDLLGFEAVECGNPIDWHRDAVHHKQAPQKVFHQVRFLDFQEVGDSKITWELNRHQHLLTLAKAYRLSGNERYLDEILAQWRHWWSRNPYPIGINWASSLEAAFRSMAWLWTYHVLEGEGRVRDLRNEWLRGLALHGRHIERYLSTYFSPNTHLLGEAVSLFFLGVLCPELKAAERWKRIGWDIILREARRQIRSDGFHFEQSMHYHVYALDLLLHSAILAYANAITVPKDLEVVLQRMSEALHLLGRGGPPPSLGDDDGGRLFDPQRNQSEHLLDPLATGAILFNRGDYKTAAVHLREETIWLLGAEGVQRWDQLEASPINMQSAKLEESGLYLLTAESPAAQLIFDCGPHGAGSGGHGHADALNVTLQSGGHSLLIDPGTLEYAGEGADRNLFRGTSMHNTLRADGQSQSEPTSAFSWRRLPESKVERSIQADHFDLVMASHDGYQRLAQPLIHRRWVFSIRNGAYLIRDLVEGEGRHRFDVTWHFGPEMQLVDENVFQVRGASAALALLPASGKGWAEEARKESSSPAYGRRAPMNVITFSSDGHVPTEFAVLLVTLENAHRSPGRFFRTARPALDSGVKTYEHRVGPEEQSFFFGKQGQVWKEGAVTSDAEFVYRHQTSGKTDKLIMVNGSHVEVASGPELRFKRSIRWSEMTLEGNRIKTVSSEPEALEEEFCISIPQPQAGFQDLS